MELLELKENESYVHLMRVCCARVSDVVAVVAAHMWTRRVRVQVFPYTLGDT